MRSSFCLRLLGSYSSGVNEPHHTPLILHLHLLLLGTYRFPHCPESKTYHIPVPLPSFMVTRPQCLLQLLISLMLWLCLCLPWVPRLVWDYETLSTQVVCMTNSPSINDDCTSSFWQNHGCPHWCKFSSLSLRASPEDRSNTYGLETEDSLFAKNSELGVVLDRRVFSMA